MQDQAGCKKSYKVQALLPWLASEGQHSWALQSHGTVHNDGMGSLVEIVQRAAIANPWAEKKSGCMAANAHVRLERLARMDSSSQ